MAQADVSYIVAAYNAAPFIADAIASALDQRGAAIEVVVADDVSRDDTAAIVEGIAARDGRVRLLRMPRNGGPSAARNAAIAAARGRWIAVLDADDLLLPDRTAALLDLAATTGADIVADNLERFEDGTGRTLSTLLPQGLHPYAMQVQPHDYLRANVIIGGTEPGLGYLKPMFRRELLTDRAAPYDERVRIGEDFVLCMEALVAGAAYVVTSEVGYRYRVRPHSLSHRLGGDDIARLRGWYDGFAARPDLPRAPAFGEALGRYGRALQQAALFTEVVDELKAVNVVGALRRAGSRADLWPLLMRHGLDAVVKRVGGRRRPQPVQA
jgi:succinoglycan biosynthesis protein ExoO